MLACTEGGCYNTGGIYVQSGGSVERGVAEVFVDAAGGVAAEGVAGVADV